MLFRSMQFLEDACDSLLVLDEIITSYVNRVNTDVRSIRIYMHFFWIDTYTRADM